MEVLSETQNSSPPQGVECTICLSNDAKDVGLLRCQHTFCFECIESWSEHENSCPLCKVRFTYIDKMKKEAMLANPGGKRKKLEKERIKIKRKNQTDYEPAYHPHDGIDVWANFIASLVGAGNQQLRRFQGLANDLPFQLLGMGHDHTHRAAPRRTNLGGRRIVRPSRRVPAAGDTANNPIALLSDDEGDTQPAPSSSRAAGTAQVVDLTGDGEDVPLGPGLAQPRASSSSSAAIHGAPVASSSGAAAALLQAVEQYSDTDASDEDYDPEVGLGFSDHSDGYSDEFDEDEDEATPRSNEVIELPDSDAESDVVVDRNGAVVPQVSSMPPSRLSGIMVWCRDCDTFHDKQRVWDDQDYCRATYDSLLATDGFADIVRTHPNRVGFGTLLGAPATSSSSSAPCSAATPVPENAGSDDENAPWLECRSQQTAEADMPVMERTQSDATTSSSRSKSSSTGALEPTVRRPMAQTGVAKRRRGNDEASSGAIKRPCVDDAEQ